MSRETPRIVVGYDGSDFSMQALDWAMDEAEWRKLPLTVCHAWQWPYGPAEEEARAHLGKAAEHVLWHGADCARSCSAVADVRADLYEGRAEDRLVELSAGAELVVVGSRGLDAVARETVGSVAGRVAAGAACPVIVVRGPGPVPLPPAPGPVVAGMTDDTPDEVLAFALGEAEVRALDLLTVHAGELRPAPSRPFAAEAGGALRSAERDFTTHLLPWRERYPSVHMQSRFVAGPPGEALLAASREASLLVLGRGAEPGRLGAVTGHVLQHAMCPVAVVPCAA
ncbi:nucleotide-binding universal stress UspA family protein [Thermocatellispora tengchongensis]|uniref:Nucleotide-binding universal stress UspA family protein n=1 Tax=Thermocatellispora tengchongensis TaxID=1073253 RepID=A0A840PF39_9ACTN|nr:universal stress protein [Thermocatellispora tengchongensis]MBB5135767.1 nucleotide-binding universal stress UspA family protein [Thermocatellispora tengchongensis]